MGLWFFAGCFLSVGLRDAELVLDVFANYRGLLLEMKWSIMGRGPLVALAADMLVIISGHVLI